MKALDKARNIDKAHDAGGISAQGDIYAHACESLFTINHFANNYRFPGCFSRKQAHQLTHTYI